MFTKIIKACIFAAKLFFVSRKEQKIVPRGWFVIFNKLLGGTSWNIQIKIRCEFPEWQVHRKTGASVTRLDVFESSSQQIREGSLSKMRNVDRMILYSGTMDILCRKMDANPRSGSGLNNKINNKCLCMWSPPVLGNVSDGMVLSWGQWFLCAPI